jgi:hypothetical protein
MAPRILAAAVAGALCLPGAAAAADESSAFSFSGFGTLGGVKTDNDKAEFVTSVLQPKGPSDKVDYGVDSLLALQASYKATPKLSFVGQLVSNRNADNRFTPHVEWAFVRYAFTGDLSVRGGIMAAPIFMASESRLVGFANPWVRTPTALYSQVPFTSFRGVDLVYRHNVGDVSVSVQPYFGKAPTEVPNTGGGHITTQIDRMTGINVSAEIRGWTARAGYMQTRFTYSSPTVDQLFGGLAAIDPFVPGAANLAKDLSSNDKKISFASVGLGYEGANVFFQTELGRRRTDLFLADTTAWYSTLGYRVGDFMPFATVSQVKVDSPTSNNLVPPVGPLAAISFGLNSLLASQNYAQKTVAAGVRYQFAKSADVKVQWDRVKLPSGALGNFIHATPDFGGTVNVYSATVDFVF